MRGGALVREARRRAGLTQVDLAGRTGTTQPAIARLESGLSEPSFRRVSEAVRACGLELVPLLREADESDWSVAVGNLSLTPQQRVENHQRAVRFAEQGREAMRRALR
jgi:transcriptional regulator with XRE-family HTH domain